VVLAKTQYARSGDADIAYQVIGDGPHDVVLAFDFASHLEKVAGHPLTREFLARICDLAAPGEVLVTRTVRDLVAGSGIAFEERGEHELKGVPDTWALYAVTG